MKNLKITVNGREYDVSVEEVGASAPSAQAVPAAPAAPAAAPVASAAPARPAAPAPKPVSGGTVIKCPMPGTIISVNVKPGDKVSKGQVLVVFEAMKMENEIQAAGDGTVASVAVRKGDSVNADDVLLTIA